MKLLTSLLIASAIVLLNTQSASACSPAPGSRPAPIAQHAVLGDIVLVGTVLEVEETAGAYGLTATISVDDSIKGEVNSEIEVDGFGFGPDCRSVVSPESWKLFFIERSGDRLEAHYTFPWDAVSEATEENVAEARRGALLGPSIYIPIAATTAE